MSEGALIWVDALTGLDPTSKGILNRLASVADDDDCAWMRVEDLATRVGASVRTIQSRLRLLEGAGDREAYIRNTGRTHRVGTRNIPLYELAVDQDLVAAVRRQRRARRDAEAGTKAMGATACTHAEPDAASPCAAKGSDNPSAMGADCCTHSATGDDTICTRMGATACTPKEAIRDSEFTNVHSARARTPEVVAQAVLDAWPEEYRQRSGVREVASALRRERKGGADIERIAAGCIAWVKNRKNWGRDGGPKAPHNLIASGRWETSASAALPKGSAGTRTGFAVPDDVWAEFFGRHGEAQTESYLRPCGWRASDRTLLAKSGTAEAWLRQHGYRVERQVAAGRVG